MSWISVRSSKVEEDEQDLDTLVGNLYDDLDSKVQASHKIFLMTLDIGRLGAITSHTSAVGALARVLREEGKKNFQLRLNTISTFLIFSFFQNFHQVVIENQIGRATLSMLELENSRAQSAPVANPNSQQSTDQVMDVSKDLEDDIYIPPIKLTSSDQEQLLYVAVHLLYNIAEDVQIQKKMRKYNLVDCLCDVLHRTNTLLLTITVAFLRKLSMYKENIDSMRESAITFKLLQMLHFKDESLLDGTLQLVFNLSFDRAIREIMVDSGIIESLQNLLQQRRSELLVLRLLYNISSDEDLRLRIVESKILSIALERISSQNDKNVPDELTALIVNLTCIPETTKVSLEPPCLEKFVKTTIKKNDAILFKALKNLSFVQSIGESLIPFAPTLVECLLKCEPCIQVEIMAILNNLTFSEDLTDSLLSETGLLDYLSIHLHASNMEDDINLQIIMFVGGACSSVTAPMIAQSGLVSKLCDIFRQRCHDADMTAQALYAMYQFVLFDSTREAYLQIFDKVLRCIIELTQDQNKTVGAMADSLLDAISDLDQSRADHIRRLRFFLYNEGWCETLEALADM